MVDMDDLCCILSHLEDVRAECYNIGTFLKLRQGDLDTIRRSNVDFAEAMTAIINNWLKLNYNVEKFGEPTWKALVDAVASPMGGNNNAVAMEIARSHPGERHHVKCTDPKIPKNINFDFKIATVVVKKNFPFFNGYHWCSST